MRWVIFFAAAVQAVAAGVIAVFTVQLVRRTDELAGFTRDYVEEMRRLNDLQAEANRLSQAGLAVAQGQAAPLLVVVRDGRNSDGSTFVESVINVENRGGGPAMKVVVSTSWGDAPLDKKVLVPGQGAQAKVRIPYDEWERGTDPTIERVRCVDAQGNEFSRAAQE